MTQSDSITNSIQHVYYKATERNNKKRVWMQGLKLEESGFSCGERFRTEYSTNEGTITLVADKNGDRVVSGRKRKNSSTEAIVELFNTATLKVLGDANRVRADFYNGSIVISIHHHDRKQEEREARLIESIKQGTITKGSLCTGIGMAALAGHQGLSEGGLKSSLEWIVDRERKYLQVAFENNDAVTSRTKIFEASLEEIEPELLTPVDHMQVSLPCTGHSKSGKSKNKLANAESHKTDATALFGLVKIIEAVNPSIIVSENVPEARNSASYTLLKAYLDALGYNIHETELNNQQSGSLEKRKRYWFVAVSKGLVDFDINTIKTYDRQYSTVGDIIEAGHEWSDNQYLKDKAISDLAMGKGFANRNLITHESTSVNTIGRHYQKRRSTEPMLVNEAGKESLLSVNECAKVKSCPLGLIEGVVASTAYQGLGQGIDYNQGRGIAHCIGEYMMSLVLTVSHGIKREAVKTAVFAASAAKVTVGMQGSQSQHLEQQALF
ncbi:MAG: DNA cytosine methyltransferase [Colwellia sp.]|jgi:Site-specific DNA methylase